MDVDDLFCVVHAAVTDLYVVAIEYFPEWVVLREVLIYQGEKSVTDVGADIFAVWWVVPKYVVSLSMSTVGGRGWLVF
ncbi:MAG: hypothetical protein GY893_13415 [bacterium]|nr:hypothetical protein [bacterium]